MEIDFFRAFFTIFNFSLLILICYGIFKLVRAIINYLNKIDKIESKLNRILENLREKNEKMFRI